MKGTGSAVLTALQSQYMSIDEIEELVIERRLKTFLNGGNPFEWLDCFWENIAIMEANKCCVLMKQKTKPCNC